MSNPTDRPRRTNVELLRSADVTVRTMRGFEIEVHCAADELSRLRGEVARLTADPKTSIHAAVLRAERLEAEVARLQSERDRIDDQATKLAEWNSTQARMIEQLRSEVTAANLVNEQLLQGNVDPVDVIAAIVKECLANRAALARVTKLHWRYGEGCFHDAMRWPCPTVRAAVGTTPEPEEETQR